MTYGPDEQRTPVAPPDPLEIAADLPGGRWSADADAAVAAATDLLDVLTGTVVADLEAERSTTNPDPVRLDALRAELEHYAAERQRLSLRDPRHVEQVRRHYGPIVRQRSAEHRDDARDGHPGPS